MILVVCATEFEIWPLLKQKPAQGTAWDSLVTGVGIVETSVGLTRFLATRAEGIDAVINIGVAGAYVYDGKKRADLLDICIAEQEHFGDLGICYDDHIEPLAEHLLHATCYNLDSDLRSQAETLLLAEGLDSRCGAFVTVNAVSATEQRGAMIGGHYPGLCENMEGAAVARVCEEFAVPMLEIRTISNMVEDRNRDNWKLQEACEQVGKAAAIVLRGLKIK